MYRVNVEFCFSNGDVEEHELTFPRINQAPLMSKAKELFHTAIVEEGIKLADEKETYLEDYFVGV